MDIAPKTYVTERLARLYPWLLIGLCLYWFLPTWVLHIYRTFDPFTFNDDARILIWPFFRDADPTLFHQDPFIDYFRAGLPIGYLALFRALGWLGWAKVASEILPYCSVMVATLLLADCARRMAGSTAAFIAVVLALGSEPLFDRAGGGLPRAFAYPLVSAGLWALIHARPRLLSMLAVVAAAFYPVVTALLGLSLFFLLVLSAWQSRWPRRSLVPNATASVRARLAHVARAAKSDVILLSLTLALIVLLLIPVTLRLLPYGHAITPAMLPQFPEAAAGGRLTPDQHAPFESFAVLLRRHSLAALTGIGEPLFGHYATWLRAKNQMLLVGAGIAIARLLFEARRRPELLRLCILLLAAGIGHALACRFAPQLFLPERYAQYGVPPFVIVATAAGFGLEPRAVQHRASRLALQGSAILALLLAAGGRGTSWVGIEVYVPPAERSIYAAFSRLPVNAVIAGWPAGPVENIPYLSARRVLTNFQVEMPFHERFTLESRNRLDALFQASFATRPEPIQRLCSEFQVTHFLVDSTQPSAARAPDYYAPHRATIARLHASTFDKKLLLTELASRATSIKLSDTLTLVELARHVELAPACSFGTLR
ncbi:MAG TPA: hypothetical protein VIV60_00695 [Polyangiaceae bacterium]